ncbi:hypothetical protein [uncultured Sphaerochaeta sp.]|uniref:hypothetical protein n=1 Tax=uncultured Sphaerochaeta sp. TaxID=886478 RepID=UPI002AA73DE1|nr:hypothetical protein [uncultured Sphaerochaeta sp.]
MHHKSTNNSGTQETSEAATSSGNSEMLERLSLQERLIEAIAHDVRSPLISMKAMKESMENGMLREIPSLWSENFSELDELLERIDSILESTAVLHLDEQTYPLQVIAASDFLYPTPIYLSRLAAARQVSLALELEEDVLVLANQRLMRLVMRILNDALTKLVSANNTITTKLSLSSNVAYLCISCTGLQICDELVSWVSRGQLPPDDIGLGFTLHLAWHFMRYLGGSLSVEHDETGVLVQLELPRFISDERSNYIP